MEWGYIVNYTASLLWLSELSPKPYTLNPKPQILTPKPQTLNPKPQTPNPKPETLNPKPWVSPNGLAGTLVHACPLVLSAGNSCGKRPPKTKTLNPKP